MIAYTLDKNIDGQKIISDIENLVQKFVQNEPNKIPILYIDIRSITREDTSLIPKLEHKNLEPDCFT